MTCVGYCFPVVTTAAVVAGPAVAVAALAVGAGVLVVGGLVWYGQKLQENYEDACREWADLHDAVWAEQLSRVSVMPDVLQAARRLGPAPNLMPSDAGAAPPDAGGADPRVAALLAEVRAAQRGAGVAPAPDGASPVEDDVQRRARLVIAAADRQVQALVRVGEAGGDPAAYDRWAADGREAVRLQGALLTLDRLRREMAALDAAPPQQLDSLGARIAAATQAVDAALAPGAGEPGGRLRAVAEQVRWLEEEALRMARRGQQRRLAGIVATTMGELGYRDPDGTGPSVRDGGDVLTVTGLRTNGDAGGSPLLAIDVSPDGVGYDFSGYAGDASRGPALELVEALRERGVLLLDGGALERLGGVPASEVTEETLDGMRFVPRSEEHKDQARIAEQVLTGMARRGYRDVRHRPVGGTIDIEARTGDAGYRVSVPPHGPARILRDGQDVARDRSDPVAADAVLESASDEEESAVEEQRERIQAALRRSLEQRRRSALRL